MGRNKKNSSRRNKRGGQPFDNGSAGPPTSGFLNSATTAITGAVGSAEEAAKKALDKTKEFGSSIVPGMGASNEAPQMDVSNEAPQMDVSNEAPQMEDQSLGIPSNKPFSIGDTSSWKMPTLWGGRRRKGSKSRKMRGGKVVAAPQGFQSYGHVGGQSASRAMTTLGYASVKGGRRRRKSKKGTKKRSSKRSGKRRRSRRA